MGEKRELSGFVVSVTTYAQGVRRVLLSNVCFGNLSADHLWITLPPSISKPNVHSFVFYTGKLYIYTKANGITQWGVQVV